MKRFAVVLIDTASNTSTSFTYADDFIAYAKFYGAVKSQVWPVVMLVDNLTGEVLESVENIKCIL